MRKVFSVTSAGLMLAVSTLVVLGALVASTGVADASITAPGNGATVLGTVTVTESPGGQKDTVCWDSNANTYLSITNSSNTTIESWSNNGGTLTESWNTESHPNGTYTIHGSEKDRYHKHWYSTSCSDRWRYYTSTVYVKNREQLTYTGATSGEEGTSVTVSAVSKDVGTGHVLPNENIKFQLAGGATVYDVTNSQGVATATLPVNGPPRTTTIEASWGGSTYHIGSSVTKTFTVEQDPSKVDLTSSDSSSVWGEPVHFTAVVSGNPQGGGTPTGHVQFKIDGSNFGGEVALSGGKAISASTSSLSIAGHTVQAWYLGDDADYLHNYDASITQTVNKADTNVAVSSSANPARHGQAVQFSATVTAKAPGAGSPTGTVQFAVDGAPLGGPITLSGGHATSPSIATLSTGNHTVTATYAGDGHFNVGQGSLSQAVDTAQTAVALTSTDNAAVYGEPVTVTASVVSLAPGEGVPTGTVQFSVNGNALGAPVALNNGQASVSLGSLAAGTYTVTAHYAGSNDFAASDAAPMSQVVSPAETTLQLDSSANPSVFGQSVTFTATVPVTLPGAGTPTGTVAFTDGSTVLGTIPLTAHAGGPSTAVLSVSSLSVGAHTVAATYTPDTANFTGSANSIPQQVDQSPTSTVLTSSANPSVTGQAVTLTATVAAAGNGNGAPTGSVSFTDGTTALGVVPLTNGTGGDQATLTLSSLAVGTHGITASYLGDTNFLPSQGSANQAVDKAPTATAIQSSANPSQYGDAVTFTAAVTVPAPGAGTPTGTVQFAVSGVALGDPVAVEADGTATSVALTGVAPGTYQVTATYSGDADELGSSNSLSQKVGEVSAVTLSSATPNPSVATQPVTFTATVGSAGTGTAVPSGTVDFYDGPYLLGFGQLTATDGGATATFTTTSLAIGTHTVTANYLGNYDYNPSTSDPVTQTVTQIATATAVTSSTNPSVTGQGLTYTATVTPAYGNGAPSGTVTFTEGTTTLGSAPLATVSGAQTASITVPAPPLGDHTILATYSGDATYTGSANHLTQTVQQGNAAVNLVANTTPTVWGQPTTFTATVTPTGAAVGTPTGTVTFTVDGSSLATPITIGDPVALDGVGTATSAAISSLSPGTYTVTAAYSGDGLFQGTSGTAGQTVAKAATASAVASGPNPSVLTQTVTLTATVTVVSPGAGTPTGTVTFHDGSTTLGTAPVTAGSGGPQATLTTASLGVGTHAISATYDGDADFAASTSAATNQVVNKIASATAVVTSASPSVYGDQVTFTATVHPAYGAGAPSGTVTFTDGTTTLGAEPLTAGAGQSTASLSVATLGGGSHTIEATYSGDATYLASDGSTSQVVQAAPTSLTANDAVVQVGGLLTSSVLGPLHATLTGPGGPLAGQTLVFTAGTTQLCTVVTGTDGVATCNANSQLLAVTLAGGYHVAFAGTADYQASEASPGLVYGQVGS